MSEQTLLSSATLTGSYQYSSIFTLTNGNSLTVRVAVDTAESVTASLKPQWSIDGTTWVDEQQLVAGTVAAGEAPYTISSKRVDVDLSSTSNAYMERYNRLATYFRVAYKSSGVTTGAISIYVSGELL